MTNAVQKPQFSKSSNKLKVYAAGFAGGWGAMQLPLAKTTLDVIYYGIHIELYTPLNIILFIGMITFGVATGANYLINNKANG